MFKTYYYNYKKIDIPSDDFYLNWLFFCMGKVFMETRFLQNKLVF